MLSKPQAKYFQKKFFSLIAESLPHYVREGKSYLSIAIGCTGGRHRSVVMAEELKNYLAKHGVPAKPQDLAGHNCITFEGLAAPATWSFGTGKSETAVPVRSRLQVNTAEAAIDAAIAGLGLTKVLSYQTDAAVRAGTLRVVLELFEPPPWPVSLVHPGQGLLPVKLRAFLDFAAPRLKGRLVRSL